MRGVHTEIGVIEGWLCVMNFVNLVFKSRDFESESLFKFLFLEKNLVIVEL
jgi:hypothetical protein